MLRFACLILYTTSLNFAAFLEPAWVISSHVRQFLRTTLSHIKPFIFTGVGGRGRSPLISLPQSPSKIQNHKCFAPHNPFVAYKNIRFTSAYQLGGHLLYAAKRLSFFLFTAWCNCPFASSLLLGQKNKQNCCQGESWKLQGPTKAPPQQSFTSRSEGLMGVGNPLIRRHVLGG